MCTYIHNLAFPKKLNIKFPWLRKGHSIILLGLNQNFRDRGVFGTSKTRKEDPFTCDAPPGPLSSRPVGLTGLLP